MTKGEAQGLVAMLSAMYPRDWLGEMTFEMYAEFFTELDSYEAAHEAVRSAIKTADRLPSFARIRETYFVKLHYMKPAEIEQAPLTEQEREEGLRMARALADRLDRATKTPADGGET